MTADQLIDSGDLRGAIRLVEQVLRERPRDQVARSQLFALTCLSGQWEGAERLLDVMERLKESGTSPVLDVQRYRAILAGEVARQRYFSEGASPRTFAAPGAAVNVTLSLHGLGAAGEWEKAGRLLDEYENGRPARAGRYRNQPFDDFRDVEDWMSPVLEVLAPEGYFWVGWDEVEFLDVPPPRSLLDLVWAPARLGLFARVLGAVVIPSLYPESWRRDDDAVKLGRRNEWIDLGAGLTKGAGAKIYQVGEETVALLDLADLSFDRPAEAGQ
jgi:type VI secretion system protein ImpE